MQPISNVIPDQIPEQNQAKNQTVYRSNPKKYFTILKNSTLRKKIPSKNKSLSFIAKAIFLEALTHDPSFIFTVKSLAKIHGISVRQARYACNLLIEHGHARRIQIFDEKSGKILRHQYVFYEDKYKEGDPPQGRQTDTEAEVIHVKNHMTKKCHMDIEGSNPRQPGPGTPKNHMTKKCHMDTFYNKKKQKEETTTGKTTEKPEPTTQKNVVVVSSKIKKTLRREIGECCNIITPALKNLSETEIIAQVEYVNGLDDKDKRHNYPGAIRTALEANNGAGYILPAKGTKKTLSPQEISLKQKIERKKQETEQEKRFKQWEEEARNNPPEEKKETGATEKPKRAHTKKDLDRALVNYTFMEIIKDPSHELYEKVNNGKGKIEDIEGFSDWMKKYKPEFEKKDRN